MKYKIFIRVIMLSLSVLFAVACSSNDDIIDVKSDSGIQILSETEDTPEYTDSNTIKISFTNDSITLYTIPIQMMSEEEFEKANEGKIFKTDNKVISRRPSEPVDIRPHGDGYDVTLFNNILEVLYSTKYPYEFPLDPKAYHMRYACGPNEHPGKSVGKASHYELTATLDIIKEYSDKDYRYSHTVGLKATIHRDKMKFEVE